MNTVQVTEYLYEWRTDRLDGQMPDEWFAYCILKRTKQFIFFQYTPGINHPYKKTMRLNRAELEANGQAYWHHGTWVMCLYTEEGKKKYDLKRAEWCAYVPECLKVLGLTREATVEDVKRAYHEAALKAHPDTGGSHEGFLKLQEHYRVALRMVQS